MNKIAGLLSLALLIGCSYPPKSSKSGGNNQHKTGQSVQQTVIDTVAQLEAFLDSIGRLPLQPIADKVAYEPDSIFKSQKQLDTVLSKSDFDILKQAALKGVMPAKVARRIFRNNDISDSCNQASVLKTYQVGLIPVVYYPFSSNKHDFKEFALSIGDEWHCINAYLYFFSGNRIIARHDGYNRDGLDLNYYRDADGKTVVYYDNNFGTGSGEWWDNFYFYKYDNNKLIPILDELENGNIQPPYFRARWLESTVESTHPLTIKMVYYQNFNQTISLPDTTYYQSSPNYIDDSTLVRYSWDEKSKTLKGNYDQSKLSKAQIMSYYQGDNEYLFINAYYKLLKQMLKNDKQRKWVLSYLEQVKNKE
jgi:hypothetical protein